VWTNNPFGSSTLLCTTFRIFHNRKSRKILKRDHSKRKGNKRESMRDKQVTVVELGYGTVGISNFTTSDSEKGILFAPFDEPHEIGITDPVNGPYQCTGGEVIVFCSKKESALVLLEQVQNLVNSFD
jgi:hypothetical protein